MNTMSTYLPEGVLVFENDGQWITSNLPQPDPSWRTTDSRGHGHAYADGPDRYPTLVAVTGEPYWCDDCRDEHTDTWYECRLCHEKITPGAYVDHTPKWIGDAGRYYLDGEPITKEQAQELLNKAVRAADEAARIHDRPSPGTQVLLDQDVVTIVPTQDLVPADSVTIMRHGTGTFETVRLDQLRSKRRPGLG
ncbi:hypothetical protein AB0C80_18360 [Streptomyces anthocyanicus]|uniref:hypothetical protein n=1 Tax=Streptomyces anthocyanicus TaxID=68174 RepID=UPI0033FD664A